MNRNLRLIAGALAALLLPVVAVAAINTYTFFDSSRGDVPFNVLPLKMTLTNANSDLAVPLTVAAGTPTGAMGIDRTAGTAFFLVGEATSSSAKTDKVIWEAVLGPTYRAGNAFTVTVNANYQGNGTVTAASTTLAIAAYYEAAGVETALTVTPATQQLAAAPGDFVFTVAANTALVNLQRVVIEATVLVTSASGANSGIINGASISY